MKIEDENEKNKILRYQNTGMLSLAGSSIFDTNVIASPNTIKLASELVNISLDTNDGQTDYLLKTPKFANSVFADTSITALKLQDHLSYPYIDTGHGTYFTSDSGTIRLDTSGVLGTQYIAGALDLSTTGTLNLAGSYDISSIISTGLAVESVTGLFSSRTPTYDSSALTFSAGKTSVDLSLGAVQPIYATPAFRDTFQTIKTDFILGHESDIKQRFVMALENSVVQAKRSNDLKEKELAITEQQAKSQEKTNEILLKMMEEQQKILRLAFPSHQLEETKEGSSKFVFNKGAQTLSNSSGKSTSKIEGQAWRLLQCFDTKTYMCKKMTVIKTMGSENKHSGARKQLLTLLQGVADIVSVPNKDNKKKVDFYKLIEIRD